MTEASPTLGELIDVADVDTVVRLDGSSGRLAELVLTGDVVSSLDAVLDVASGPSGAGFFVVGPFGSGKSHFLAATGELLADPASVSGINDWNASLRSRASAARPSAVVAVPLIEYRAGAALEDVVATRAWRALGESPPSSGDDRTTTWDIVLNRALRRPGCRGLVLLLDELSEFLRAKQGPALIEDLRFLQFLGEWAGDHPVIILAALQESIEEVANVSQKQLARIRDRYRPSLALSMRHVEDLVHGRLVRLRPEALPWVERAWKEISSAFPATELSRARLDRCYPLHPDTLSLLEGLRFLLSQQRGVVDFICRRLGEVSDRRYDQLVTPDEVFDHFRGRLLERPETVRLAETVVPYFERALAHLVDDDDQELAMRTVKLLCLLAASPLERPRSADQLAAMLLTRMSDIDPSANVAYLRKAILEPLAEQGAYLMVDSGPPATYSIQLDADATLVAQARGAQLRSELSIGDRRLVATLCQLGSSPQLSLQLMREVGVNRRSFLWQNTQRSLLVGLLRVLELTADDVTTYVAQAREAGGEGCFFIGEPELEEGAAAGQRAAALVAANPRLALWVPAPLRKAECDAVLDLHSRALLRVAAQSEGQVDLVAALERSREADAAMAREILRRVYFEGQVHGVDLPSLAGLPFDRQLPRLADPLLSGLHPQHREVAPRGELVGERLVRQIVDEVIVPGRLGPAAVARGQIRPLIEGYLVPLGLARIRSDGATMAPDPLRSPAVREALRLVGVGHDGPGPGAGVGVERVSAADVVLALADGPVGLTKPEAILVLNSCVQTGLIEAWRGRDRNTDPFMAVTASDWLSPGELVPRSVRAAVVGLGPIVGSELLEPWTAEVQRRAWDAARSWLDARRHELAEIDGNLRRFGEVPALMGADPGPVLDDVALLSAVVTAVPVDLGAPAGLGQLVIAVPDPDAVLVAARRLGSVCRFLRDELRRVEEATAYLTHPDLNIPESEAVVRARRDAALEQFRRALPLAAEDRAGDLFAADREFRSAYRAVYQEAHEAYYAAVTPAELEAVRATPGYQALTRLSAIGALAVPDDRVKVDRMLAGSAPDPCRRPVNVELNWRPRCSCGFALGDRPPALDRAAVDALVESGVQQYLAELARPEVTALVSGAVADLRSLGRNELAAELEPFQRVDYSDPTTVAAALNDEVVGVLRDVLSGSQLIVTRDLAALREDLIGRRYPKRKLLDLLAAWVDATGDLPPAGFVAVVDTSEGGGAATGRVSPEEERSTGTERFLAQRFPGIALSLPRQQGADAFWLAAWWVGRQSPPPPWIPARLLADPERLRAAATAAMASAFGSRGSGGAAQQGDLWNPSAGDPTDRSVAADLVDLDARVRAESLLGDQVDGALDLGSRPAASVASVLTGERLLRQPLRLAADQLLARISTDWRLWSVVDPALVGADHVLVQPSELVALRYLLEAARHLDALEHALAEASGPTLVDHLYPAHYAPVRALLSRAELATVAGSIVESASVAPLRLAAERLLDTVDVSFRAACDAGLTGNLAVWQIDEALVRPLLVQHGRVAVLLVDALRADLAGAVIDAITAILPGRVVRRRWAVVPAPTRTAESIAAMHLGRPVAAGSVPAHPAADAVPFAHLGYESRVIVGADRDEHTADVRELWVSGPPISVAVATGLDERLHRTSVELAALFDEAVTALQRRVLPTLSALPRGVPLVVLADHGFRENRSWGKGPEGRYVHGGTSLEECVIPVVVFAPR